MSINIVKKLEIGSSKCLGMSLKEYRHFLRKALFEKGFNLNKKVYKEENLEKLTIIYTQKKCVTPKRKKI